MTTFPFASRRSPVYGHRGMVAASQPLAVAAGLEILAAGGNAADAAIATAAALNVTEPTSTGIGGDCFALYFEAATGQVTALNGSGRAPAGLTLERLKREGFSVQIQGAHPSTSPSAPLRGSAQDAPDLRLELPPYHAHTVTVPGACAGWCDLIERHGRLPLSRILAPAIRLAEEGFPVAPITAYFWQRGAERQLAQAPNGRELTIEGRGPRPGELFRNPGLARTLQAVAEGGKDAFYRGAIAEAIAAVVQSAGGCMTVDDLAGHTSTWDEPISTTYRPCGAAQGEGLRVWECPPNGQGLVALLALNILEGFNLAALDPLGPERMHLVIEALRLAFADARWYVADPAAPETLRVSQTLNVYNALLSKAYAADRRKLINPARATLDQRRGTPVAGSDTVYFCVVDDAGNACSFINSNYMGFGTGIVPAGWGFSLQNRGHNFSLDPAHPNALAPGKRPYHTIIPGMMTRDRKLEAGELEAEKLAAWGTASSQSPSPRPPNPQSPQTLIGPFGVMGGFMQPQGHVQVVLALAEDGLDPQAALDRPRFCIEAIGPSQWDGAQGSKLALEEGLPAATVEALAGMGHPVELTTGYARAIFGRGQIIVRDPKTGVLCGGSDPRADGCAMAL